MFQKINLKLKLFFLVTAVVVISFLVVILVVSDRSVEMAKNDAFALAQERAEKYKHEIMAELQGARVTSETLKPVLETLKDYGITDRDLMNDMLQRALQQKEYITAFCIAYDPDALDGKDALYAGVGPAYDETGRYAPYWNKLGSTIDVQPLYDIDISDWYIVPRETKQEYITDPYPYEVQGNTVMLASFVFPILHDDEFIGIISSDIVLDKLQEMVSQVSDDGRGGYTEILSNSGAVVAHPDKQYLGMDLDEVLIHSLLVSEPGNAAAAVEQARAYFAENEAADDLEAKRQEAALANLAAYAETSDPDALDSSLLSPELARALIQVDPAWSAYAEEARQAIGQGETYIFSGDHFYTVYAPIQFSASTNPWSVAVSIPMAKVLQNADEVRDFVIITFMISVLVLAVCLYLIANSVTKPIRQLTTTAKELGEGNFDAQIPTFRGSDEISVLAKAFQVMAQKISDQVTHLQNYASELEEKNHNLKSLNEMLVIARDEAEQSSRAKGNFLSNMSHEMRTPMNAIIGMTSIGESSAEIERKDYAFQKIKEASDHLLGVINDVLDMSKIEANKLELCNAEFELEKMLQTAVHVIGFSANQKTQALHIKIDPRIPQRLNGDEQRLAQVVTNLLSNAVKFSPEHGTIRLEARLVDEVQGLCTVEFVVQDNGIGINEDQQERLFNSFEQADNSTSRKYGGTGLGLAISKNIVQMMGGSIQVDSRVGECTRFTFTVVMQRGAERQKLPLAGQVDWSAKKVLVCASEEDVVGMFSHYLRELHIPFSIATSLAEVEQLSAQAEPCDIAFIDWDASGAGIAAALLQWLPDTQLIVLLANTGFEAQQAEAQAAGVHRFLVKPLFLSDIAQCLNESVAEDLPAKAASSPADGEFTGRRLLLAEDVDINREIVLALLEPTGLDIDCAENGKEALRLFEAHPERYDLVFMDVQMPEMDGLEATRRIRALPCQEGKDIPIIAMTANVFKEDIDSCLAAGMNDHVGKPLALDVVMEKLRKYIKR